MAITRKQSAQPRRAKLGKRINSLGLNTDNVVDLAKQVKTGLPYRALAQFHSRSELPMESIARIARIPRRTLARRKRQGRLTGPESERLLRLATVFDKAVGLFEGDVLGARTWLESRNKALGNETPLATVETEIGAREVEDLIGRLEHGVFS
jgi:putative toxin-antitoxin system antitoxin component (TIGR02293 family)